MLASWAAGGGVNYILLDRFTTNASAPLTTPRTCEPGPGQLTIVDTNSIISIVSSQLVINGTPAANDRVVSGALARAAGRAFVLSVPSRTTVTTGGQFRVGFGAAATDGNLDIGLDYSSTTAIRIKTGASVIDTITLGAGTHDIACVMRATGGFLLTRVGGTGNYTLQWIYNATTTAEIAKIFNTSATALNVTCDDFRILDLGGAWATDYGIATDRKATTAANDTIVMAADAIVEHTITAATGVTQELHVRRSDATHKWIVRMDQVGGTIKLIEDNAGETERSSAAQTWTNGTQYRVVVVCDGNTIKTYVANVAKNSYTSATFNNAATGVLVDRAGTDLVAWPRTIALPNV